MRKAILFSLAAFVVASSMAGAAKMPKGSFLKSHVTNVDQLADQVINDAIVAARYARHFRSPRNSLVDYFRMNLKVGKLRKDYETTVYRVTGKVDISSTRKTLAKGSYVFVLSNGQPILEAGTGCPLGDSLPLPIAAKPNALSGIAGAEGNAPGVVQAIGGDDVVTKVLGVPGMEVGAAPDVILAGAPTDAAAAIFAPNAASVIEPLVEIMASAPVSAAGSFLGMSSMMSGFLPVAAALGGVAMMSGGGSNDSPSVPPPPTPIPEPSGLLAIAVGGSGIIAAGFSRRFRR